MLVWLASYPRSGNTMVRAILNECLGLTTQPLHGEGDNRVFATPELRDLVGHKSSGLSNQALIDHAEAQAGPVVVKTHEPPMNNARTILVVRHGQSALVSYFNYMRDIEKLQIPLEDIIRGEVYAGSWSDHYRTWGARPDTLTLRYEQIVADADRAAAQMATFVGVPVRSKFTGDFPRMKKEHPTFFNRGRGRLPQSLWLPKVRHAIRSRTPDRRRKHPASTGTVMRPELFRIMRAERLA